MARTRKPKKQYIRIVNSKLLYVSSGASATIGARLDVYECGQVMALIGHSLGEFHAGYKSTNCQGKNICSSELAQYLCQKYQVEPGARLPAWEDPKTEDVLFFGISEPDDKNRYSMDRFTKLELVYHKRFGEWVYIEDNALFFTAAVRAQLPRRLSLYEGTNSLALISDAAGPYVIEYRERKGAAIYCRQLVDYCKAKFGDIGRSMLLHALPLENGVRFAMQEDRLHIYDQLQKRDLGDSEDCFITLIRGRSVYISKKALRILGTNINLYSGGQYLALKGEPYGSLVIRRNGYQHLLHSLFLKQTIEQHYPGAAKLYGHEHGDLLVLTRALGETNNLPTPDQFRHVPIQSSRGTASVRNTERWRGVRPSNLPDKGNLIGPRPSAARNKLDSPRDKTDIKIQLDAGQEPKCGS